MLPKIPYFQTTRYRVQTMLSLATSFNLGGYVEAEPREKMVDLGAGDGRIVIAFAQKGMTAVGYETDEKLIKLAEENIHKAGVEEKAKIIDKDFWQEDLSHYDIVTIYGMPDVMDALEKKLREELKSGARVVSNYYAFPNWKEATKQDNVYLYIQE